MKRRLVTVACIGAAALSWSILIWRVVPEVNIQHLRDGGMSLPAARSLFLVAREVPPLLLFLAGCWILLWVAREKASRLWWVVLAAAGLRGLVAAGGVLQSAGPSELMRSVANDVWVFGWFPASVLLTVAAVIMLVEPLASAPLAKRSRPIVAISVVLASAGTLLFGGPALVMDVLMTLSLPLAAVLGRFGVPTSPVISATIVATVTALWYLIIRTAFASWQRSKPQESPVVAVEGPGPGT